MSEVGDEEEAHPTQTKPHAFPEPANATLPAKFRGFLLVNLGWIFSSAPEPPLFDTV